MTTAEFLSSLRERDVRLWLQNGQLKCDAPPGVLDAESREQLAVRKDELVALITAARTILDGPRSLVPIKPSGDLPALFARPGHNGDVFCYRALAKHLDPRRPLYGVQPQGLDGGAVAGTVEEIAAYEVSQIRSAQPEGPYHIAGFCAGGAIAFESARQLTRDGHEVARVVLFGSPFPEALRAGWIATAVWAVRDGMRRHAPGLATGSMGDRVEYVRGRMRARMSARHARRDPANSNRRRVEDSTLDAVKRYYPGYYSGRVDTFLPSEVWRRSGDQFDEWKHMAEHVSEYVGPHGANGDNMLREPYVSSIAVVLNQTLRTSGDHDAAV